MSSSDIEQPKSTVYATLDAWRGLACLAVVLCHATVTLGGERVALQSTRPLSLCCLRPSWRARFFCDQRILHCDCRSLHSAPR